MQNPPKKSLTSIQALRFFAAFMVVVHHAVNELFPRAEFPQARSIHDFFYFGAAGVQIFFVISGLVMVYASRSLFQNEGSWKTFLYRRIVRIYPLYFICLLANIVLRSLWPTVAQEGPAALIGTLLLLPIDGFKIIVPAWTLSYEMYFYLVFALVLVLPMRSALVCISAFFVLCIGAARVLHLPTGTALTELISNPILLDFLAGAWLGWLLIRFPALHLPAGLSITVLVASVAALIGNVFVSDVIPYMISFGIPSVLIVASCVFLERSGTWTAAFERLQTLGDASYSLYLIHMLVVILLAPLASVTSVASFGIWVVIMSAASLICGLLLYYFIEQPLLRMMRRAQKSTRASA